MTFSIVARDLQTGELGIAVQSRFLAVGAIVPWAKAGIGAIATQSRANTSYGPRGLELLASGLSAAETLTRLINEDDGWAERQVGIVGASGKPATYTGESCFPWAGERVGEHYACQGNFLSVRILCLPWLVPLRRQEDLSAIALSPHSQQDRWRAATAAVSNRRLCL